MNALEQIEDAVTDALGRFNNCDCVDDFNIVSWPQVWADESFGFKGFVQGDKELKAQTIIIFCEREVNVYHGGKFAYHIDNPKPDFWLRVAQHNLPGLNETLIREEFK